MRLDKIIQGLGPGDLRTRITFQKRNDIPDAGGGSQIQWSDVYSCWAYIMAWDNGEKYQNQQLTVMNTYKAVVRYWDGMADSLNVIYPYHGGQKTLRVQSWLDWEQRGIWIAVDLQELNPIEATT